MGAAAVNGISGQGGRLPVLRKGHVHGGNSQQKCTVGSSGKKGKQAACYACSCGGERGVPPQLRRSCRRNCSRRHIRTGRKTCSTVGGQQGPAVVRGCQGELAQVAA